MLMAAPPRSCFLRVVHWHEQVTGGGLGGVLTVEDLRIFCLLGSISGVVLARPDAVHDLPDVGFGVEDNPGQSIVRRIQEVGIFKAVPGDGH